MHIPDGFLDLPTSVASGGLAVTGVGLALSRVRRTLPARRVPVLGLTAAFVFATQLLNFPVAGGTSGHLVGGAVASALVGPNAAVVVMTAVLVLQCLLFADGGLTALGANVFLMALVAPFTAAAVASLVRAVAGASWRARLFGAAFGAWCSVVAAALVCSGQLALAGAVAWRTVTPAMVGVHAVIGLGEAVITALVLSGVARLAPGLVLGPEREREAVAPVPITVLAWGLVFTIGLALFVAPFASPWPDGLEHVAERLGFAPLAAAAPVAPAPFPDGKVPGLSGAASVAAAATAGVLTAFATAWIVARALARHAPRGDSGGA